MLRSILTFLVVLVFSAAHAVGVFAQDGADLDANLDTNFSAGRNSVGADPADPAENADAQAENDDIIRGDASVVDADIIRIGTQRVILWGVDAPERGQFCYRNGEKWNCQDAAFRKLQILAGRGTVTCYLLGEPDPFNRRHGVCESGDANINDEMVRSGFALAFSEQTDEYEQAQVEALVEERGMWSLDVEFEPPWEFRRANTPGGYR